MKKFELSFECPFPITQYPFITMAHGAGGRFTQNLLDQIIRPAFNNSILNQQHDGAHLELDSSNLVITTDSYVIHPLFFPGGDIGELAITGTINDLAMCGAKPQYITCSFILCESLPTTTFIQIVDSMRLAALANNIQIVAGDLKVVEKVDKGGLYINTTGIGKRITPKIISPKNIRIGDSVIVSGDIGRHGLAILAQRGDFDFQPPITSDCAPLWPVISKLIEEDLVPDCMRDLTRGGLAGNLIELATTASCHIEINEFQVPVSQQVFSASEILGLDPLYIANEGRMVIITPEEQAEPTLAILKQFPNCQNASLIGSVVKDQNNSKGAVNLKTPYGSKRTLMQFSGEQLPRIC